MSKSATPADEKSEPLAKVKALAEAYVRAVKGDILHLITNVVFTKDPKKVEIDGFLQAQLDAGKVEIITP